ncbi:MAG: DUF6603 domain-containing protein [Pseudomonadota bacterium]
MSSSQNILLSLVDLVRAGIEEFETERYSAYRIEQLLMRQGWNTRAFFDPDHIDVAATLTRLLELLPDKSGNVEPPLGPRELLDLSTEIIDTAQAISNIATLQPSTLKSMAADLLLGLALEGLNERFPPLAAALQALAIVSSRTSPAILEGGQELRVATSAPGVNFEQLGSFISAPVPTIAQLYGSDGEYGPEAAAEMLSAFLRTLGLGPTLRLGIDDNGNAALAANLSVAGGDLDLVIAALSNGLAINVAIDWEASTETENWRFGISGTGGPQSVTITGSGAQAGTSNLPGSFEVSASQLEGSPPYRLAINGGPGIEVGGLSLKAGLVSERQDPDYTASLEIGQLKLFLASGMGDGFISKALGGTLESLNLQVSLSFSTDHGFCFDASVGLEKTFTVMGSLFGDRLRVSEVTIALEAVDEGMSAELAATGQLSIAPIRASIEGIGTRLVFSDETDVLFKPPTGLGLSIEAQAVKGGGFIQNDADAGRYVGALVLDIPPVALTAFGLLDTQMPDGSEGWSLLVFVSGEFPPVQLGFGFTLLGLGGLVGLHRDIDVDALFTAVRAGKAGRLLSPEDPVRDAPILARDASAIFPIQRGQHVFGPTVKLGWGSPEPLIKLDLALALTLPEPLRLVLIGTLRARVPDEKLPLVKLNVDVAGVLDFSAQRFDLEGAIYDSVIQGIPLSGGFAVRSCWGEQPELAFAVGGLHPAFEPPPRFPALERLAMDLSKGRNFKLRIEGYFAITSNTFQMGAGAQLKVRAAGLDVTGELGFDTLIVFQPFSLTVDIRAMAQVKASGKSLCSVSVKGRLAGPGPWRVNGSATVEVLFFDVDVDFDTSFGSMVDAAPDRVDVNRRLREALMRQDAWSAAESRGLVLGELGGRLLPDTTLAVAQEEVPLNLAVDLFGGLPIRGVRRTAIRALKVGQDQFAATEALTRRFAPGQLFEMDDSERLAAPAFEELESGAAFGAASSVQTGAAQPVPVGPQITIIDAPEDRAADPLSRLRESQFRPRATAARREGKAKPAPARLSLRPEPWVATGDGLAAIGVAGSYQEARMGNGTPARLAEALAG